MLVYVGRSLYGILLLKLFKKVIKNPLFIGKSVFPDVIRR